MNQQTIQGNWNYLKGEIRKEWSDVTGRELDEFEGSLEQLVGMIQTRTGQAREEIEEKISEFAREASETEEDGQSLTGTLSEKASAYAEKANEAAEQAAQAVNQTAEQAAAKLRAKYQEAEQVVKSKPMEALALSFAAGLVFGVGATMVLRSK